MFIQIYLKDRTESKPCHSDAKTLRGELVRIWGASVPGVVELEERYTSKGRRQITTHNYLVPPGYKWWETQHWIWQSTAHDWRWIGYEKFP